MRQIVLMLTIVLFGAAPVWAGSSNPDQLNVDSTFFSESPKGASTNSAFVRNSGNENSASGWVRNDNSVEGAQIWWEIWTPDKVSRKHNKGNQSQKTWVLVGYSTWDTNGTTWDSTVVEKCNASAKVKGSEGNAESAKWKLKCRGAGEELQISIQAGIRLGVLLGEYVNISKDKISISGSGLVD